MAGSDLMTQTKQYLYTYRWHIVIALFVLLFWHVLFGGKTSGFSDPNNIHRYVVGQDGLSLDDKINDAAHEKSTLTGTRDIPVFFQDYNLELNRDDATGNLVSSRGEALAGDKDEISEIEKKFMLIK